MLRPRRGQFVVRGQQLPTLYLCIIFEKRSFNRLRNIESVAKFRKWVTSPRPRPRPLMGNLQYVNKNCLHNLSVCDIFIRDEDMAHFPSKD